MYTFLKPFDVKVSLAYGIVATLWIILSDSLMTFIFAGNLQLLATLGVAKGLAYVLVTALALFVVLRIDLRKRDRVERALQDDIAERNRTLAALRESESRFATVFHASPVPTTIARLEDGHMVDVNDAYIEMIGYARDELIGRSGADLNLWVNLEDRAGAAQIFAEKGRIRNMEMWARRKSGDTIHVLGSVESIDLNGVQHIVSMYHDITELKAAQKAVQEAERQHMELENEKALLKLKEHFISVVSHEFRTPLTVIITSAELIRRYYDQMSRERHFKNFQDIVSQAEFMVGLLNDVLTLNKARAGRIEFKPESMDLKSFCQETLARIEVVDDGQHDFIFRHEGELNTVRLDAKLLQHILVNLLSNAVKYSPAGGEVQLEVQRLNGDVVFRVSDQGIGIPAAQAWGPPSSRKVWSFTVAASLVRARWGPVRYSRCGCRFRHPARRTLKESLSWGC